MISDAFKIAVCLQAYQLMQDNKQERSRPFCRIRGAQNATQLSDPIRAKLNFKKYNGNQQQWQQSINNQFESLAATVTSPGVHKTKIKFVVWETASEQNF